MILWLDKISNPFLQTGNARDWFVLPFAKIKKMLAFPFFMELKGIFRKQHPAFLQTNSKEM